MVFKRQGFYGAIDRSRLMGDPAIPRIQAVLTNVMPEMTTFSGRTQLCTFEFSSNSNELNRVKSMPCFIVSAKDIFIIHLVT